MYIFFAEKLKESGITDLDLDNEEVKVKLKNLSDFPCQFCDRVYKFKGDLTRHIFLKHNEDDVGNSEENSLASELVYVTTDDTSAGNNKGKTFLKILYQLEYNPPHQWPR